MSATATPDQAAALKALEVGDEVTIFRNLDHPCWQDAHTKEDRWGHEVTTWTVTDGVTERFANSTVTELGIDYNRSGRRPMVRVDSGHWMMLDTGLQEGCNVTYIRAGHDAEAAGTGPKAD